MRKRAENSPAGEALLVDTMQAAKMLNLGRSSIVNMADRGELTRIRLGSRAVRFSTEEITALVEDRRRSASRSAAAMGIYRLNPGPADPAA